MFSCYIFVILYLTGSLGARKTDKNIIRQHQSPVVSSHGYYISNSNHRTLLDNQISQPNDYNDSSGGFAKLRAPMYVVHASKATSTDDEATVSKIHQPREDPKLYYQSEAYLKETNGQNFNQEVASVYPGWEVVRADEKHRIPKRLLRSREQNRIAKAKLCVRCPRDRTLVAKIGVDKVILQSPMLTTCSGRKAPRSVRLIHMQGPKFGTLLEHGFHTVISRLTHKNDTLRICKIQVHVIVQTCSTNKHLISHCADRYAPCNFTCRDNGMELQGDSSLVCGEDMKWEGRLPVCRARNWCQPLSPPDVGKVSCRGGTLDFNLGLKEGSRCRIRCPVGWRWFPKPVSVCRRGNWTNELNCQLQKEIL